MVHIVSINVNGLRDHNKFLNFSHFCRQNNYEIIAIQETFWSENLISDFEKHWHGKIYFSCSGTDRQGVAFLISKKIENKVSFIQAFDGRCVHVQLQQDERIINLVNCYAPNSITERVLFFNKLQEKIDRFDEIVLLGDMNTSLSKLDRCGKTQHTEDKAYKTIFNFCDIFNIYDIWRARNPSTRSFTWRRVVDNTLIQSRIDFILVPRVMSPYVKNMQISQTQHV